MDERGGVVDGAPLGELPARRADELLAVAARRWPHAPAVVDGPVTTSFAELDRAATAWARVLRERLPEPGRVVAVAALLRAEFVAAYYGVLRAGHLVAPFVPLLREQGLAQNLGRARAALAIADGPVADRLAAVRDQLPDLAEVVGFDPAAAAGAPLAAGPRVPVAGAASVLFTSGTTGTPKAVLLSHHNLVANAVQTARAHELTNASVCVNNLPTFHPMHMNSAVCAGATQVLCAGDTFADAVALSNRHAATHLYSLPVRLLRGCADPGLSALRLTAGTAVASGGSALPVAAARTLAEHFGVPVFQGYGLAETSPLTHSDGPSSAVPGSVGVPVAGTACRVVDIETRRPLPAGEVGEVQVRGPQVMLGYLGPDGSLQPAAGDDGWFSTGDAGRLAPGGRLFLVDRLKDVFKVDNFLVAPSDIEAVVAEHPGVEECAVVDLPDPFRGSVAGALVVPRVPGLSADQVTAYARSRLPYYQHLQHVSVVDEIPRSLTGKIARRDLRYVLIARHHGPSAEDSEEKAMSAQFTVINVFTLKDPANAADFERGFTEHLRFMRAQPGFVGHQMIRLDDPAGRYVNVGWWRTPDDFQAVLASPEFRRHAGQFHQWVEVEAVPSRGLPAVRGAEWAGRHDEDAVLVVERFTVTGNADRFTAAYAAQVAATGAGDLLWVDLAAGLRDPGAYTAVSRWSSAAAYESARRADGYRAVLAEATLDAAIGGSLAASRADAALVA